MKISSVLPQLFGCRASEIPGLFVRPVLRSGSLPQLFRAGMFYTQGIRGRLFWNLAPSTLIWRGLRR